MAMRATSLLYRVEAGEDHSLGRVVYDDVDAGRRFQGPYVPPLPSYDASLHLFVRQGDDGNRVFRHVFARITLDGHGKYLFRLLVRLFPRFFLYLPGNLRRLVARLILHRLHEHSFRVLGRHPGYFFQLLPLLLQCLLGLAYLAFEVCLAAADLFFLPGQLVFLLVEGLHFLVKVRLFLGQSSLRVLELGLSALCLLLQLVPCLDDDVLRLDRRFPLGDVGLLLCVLKDLPPYRLVFAGLLFLDVPRRQVSCNDTRNAECERNYYIQGPPFSRT